LNWDIFQIRATQYYTDPEKTIKRLLRRLKKAAIAPNRKKPAGPETVSADLGELVLKKAANTRARWHEPLKPLSIESEILKN
jgi:hypothetical protein